MNDDGRGGAGWLKVGVVALGLVLAGGNPEAEEGAGVGRDTIFLRNGDQLTGHLVSLAPTGGIGWRHPDAVNEIEFSIAEATQLELSRRVRPAGGLLASCRVHMHGDGEFEGALVGMEGDVLKVDTWFAGLVEVPRERVRVVQPVRPQKPPLFEGPMGFEGWTIGEVQAQLTEAGQWRYRQGAFYARNAAAIARDVGLPELSSLQFDLAWQGVFHLAVALYADSLQPVSLANKDNEPNFGGFYSLQLNSYSADLLPVKRNEPLRYMGQVPVPAFSAKSSAQVEIRSDKRRKLVCLMVDGNVVRQWMDTNGFAGQGTAVRFVNQGRGSLRISRIRVAEWDGRFEERPTLTPGMKQDGLWLRSGERWEGAVQGIREGKVLFQRAGLTEVSEVPMDQLKQVSLATPAVGESAGATWARVHFWEGGGWGMEVEKWGDEGLLGTVPGLGRVTVHPAAVRRLEFTGARVR